MTLHDLNPFLRYAGLYPQPVLYENSVMAYDCRIFHVLRGEGVFYIGDREYPFQDHTLVYFPSGTPYRFTYSPADAPLFLVLDFDLTSEHAERDKPLKPAPSADYERKLQIPVPDVPYYTDVICMHHLQETEKELMQIHDLFAGQPFLYQEQASGILKRFLMQMLSLSHTKNKSDAARLTEQVLSLIHSRYDEDLSNQEIADAFNFHPYYLNRIVKAETGRTLHQHLTFYRIQEAKNLLSTSTMPVQEIAGAVGFKSPSQFAAAFKKATGTAPILYREKLGGWV